MVFVLAKFSLSGKPEFAAPRQIMLIIMALHSFAGFRQVSKDRPRIPLIFFGLVISSRAFFITTH